MSDIQVNVQCECYHRRGLLYFANPLAWGRPCRRCRRMMSRSNIVVVPTPMAVPAATTGPCCHTTTVVQGTPAANYQQQQQQQQYPPMNVSALPPKYDQAVASY
ncbi:uncharacterized protein LOC111079900 [Drosophila obscura]|uniref:uncharacterized protein LOC111079900 n=1 Tax=Drosophila obscura TaxID=7282 RepID=UPI001BB1BE9B|nr:uncharacterized protein LOC111079900 [Drosophila obscura]